MVKCKICGKNHRTQESAMKVHGYKNAPVLGGNTSRMPGIKKKYTAADRKKQSKNSAGHMKHPIKPKKGKR